jgi:hypothetical protein
MTSRPVRLATPQTDPATFTDHLSQAWGVRSGASAAQYLAWSESTGLFALLSSHGCATVEDICAGTILSEDGIDSLLPLLSSFGLIQRTNDGYQLTQLAEEYFLRESPFYVGPGLFLDCKKPLPPAYMKSSSKPGAVSVFQPETHWDPALRLEVQHSRNFAPGVVAARSGRFEGIRHLVDIGGGTGTIALPFVLDHPEASVTLVDLPAGLNVVGAILKAYGVEKQVKLREMDVFADPWGFSACDGMLFGNFYHMFNDVQCGRLSRMCLESLAPGGRVFLHEVLFDESKAGPMIAALWNANMRVIGGRQRTASEFAGILHDSGFQDFHITPTAGRYSLIEAIKR